MATMTVSDFINEITLESAVVSNDFACEAAIFDLMVDDDDYGYASESYDLAIDDDDLAYSYGGYGYASEEAKTFGQRFKDMLTSIGEWFKKIGRGIKQWITGIIDKIKNRSKGNATKRAISEIGSAAGDLVTAEADAKANKESLERRGKELTERLTNETDPAKREKLQNEINRLRAAYKNADAGVDKAKFNLALKTGEQLAKELGAYLKEIKSSYKLAENSTRMIEKILMDIIKTPVKGAGKENENKGATLRDYAANRGQREEIDEDGKHYVTNLAVTKTTASGALKKLQEDSGVFDTMVKKLDKIGPDIDKAIEKCQASQNKIDDRAKTFNSILNGFSSSMTSAKVRNMVKAPFPEKELIDGAQDIIDSCDEFAEMAGNLNSALGDTTKANAQTKAIAKGLSTYSNTAHKISTLAGLIVKCGNASVQFMGSSDTAHAINITATASGYGYSLM
mgnify:CR=1 FL=1